jgi:urease accessory protein
MFSRAALLLVLAALPAALFAHADHASTADLGGSFVAGLLHPVLGVDHVLAMVAVGLWGAFLGRPAIWLLPVVFPLVMAFGGALGIVGVPLPGVEVGIALSAVALGLAIAFAFRPPLAAAGLLVGAFAVFHGHAHGTELPEAAAPLAYAAGFLFATGALHAVGILFGVLVRWPAGRVAVRAGGGAISLAGAWFLLGA